MSTPFVVDDVLLNFDDNRATAALLALNALSAKTQIIFFTHHKRLVELAEAHTQATVREMQPEEAAWGVGDSS
jgi:uncharacterized protein YhaN